MRRWIFVLLLLLVLSGQARSSPLSSDAEPAPAPGLQVTSDGDRVVVVWQADQVQAELAADPLQTLPTIVYAGYELPAYLVPLRVPHSQPIEVVLDNVQAAPWSGMLTRVPAPVPQPVGGEQRPDLAVADATPLPTSPVFVLREATMRGERLVVLAVSPLFMQTGELYQAHSLQATIPGAVPLAAPLDIDNLFFTDPPQPRPTVPSAVLQKDAAHQIWLPLIMTQPADRPDSDRLPAINPRANQLALKIQVTQAGIQRITGGMLAASGLDIDTIDPEHLQLWYRDQPLALEVHTQEAGRINPAAELRFYALPPGDRWNTGDTYWLTFDHAIATTHMPSHPAAVTSIPAQATAYTTGEWYQPTLYDSTLRGPDSDHWFSAHLRTGPGEAAAIVSVPLAVAAPFATGTSVFTVTGSAYTRGPHQLEVHMGGEVQSVTWNGTGDWRHVLTFNHEPQPEIALWLVPGTGASGVQLDRVAWQLPIQLQAGEYALRFHGSSEPQSYQITEISEAHLLYDVRNPTRPVRLLLPPEATIEFADATGGGRYILTHTAALHTPTVMAHTPTDLAMPLSADALYIAPALFHAALEPLVAHRRAQGHSVAVVDVQAIYDAWSYGQVDPEAIRTFLRAAVADWDTPPVAVTLVGDGTSDPHNYLERNNTNFIPPYLAYVDPWLGEAACETCYAQLDGYTPLADNMPDLLIGRLPVKSADELTTVVNKIIGYETGPADASWRQRAIYLTDNSHEADGRRDPAGDFIANANDSIALQPATISIERLSYDPSPSHRNDPWREPNHVRARDRTLALLNQGAGLVTYFGHGHEWQWAITDVRQEPSHLIQLYEVDTLTNAERLPVVLTMTCLTSSFETPAFSGTTIDERLVLHPHGGAVAVWGPTGQGVSHGHMFMQRGFYQHLWNSATPGHAVLGTLAQAGYLELLLRGNCCQSTVRTYVILGDPLTRVRIGGN